MSCISPVSVRRVPFTQLAGHSDFEFSLPRIKKILGDEEAALSMGWWDKFKDFLRFFRPERKQDILKAVYDMMHLNDIIDENGIKSPRAHKDTVRYFTVLKNLADPVYKERFTYAYDPGERRALFLIDKKILRSILLMSK